MKLIIIGHGGCGKDYAAGYLARTKGLRNCGSVSAHCMDYVAAMLGYSDPARAYAERRERREEWAAAIDQYRKGDPAIIIREMFAKGDIIAGVRRREEFEAAKAEGLIDVTLWVEADVPYDPTNELTNPDADYMVMNDFDEAFEGDLDRFASRLLTDPRTASTV